MSLLSVIVPCYNEEESVALFFEELTKNDPFFRDKGLELEVIYIDDGSKDRTVDEVKKLREKDNRVHLVSFSRNSTWSLLLPSPHSHIPATWC